MAVYHDTAVRRHDLNETAGPGHKHGQRSTRRSSPSSQHSSNLHFRRENAHLKQTHVTHFLIHGRKGR